MIAVPRAGDLVRGRRPARDRRGVLRRHGGRGDHARHRRLPGLPGAAAGARPRSGPPAIARRRSPSRSPSPGGPGTRASCAAQAASVAGRPFVEGAKASGVSDLRILLRHVLPNSLTPLIVQVSLDVSAVILTVSALSFLGLGAQDPTPEWGLMVSQGQLYFPGQWWLVTFPGLAIVMTAVGVQPAGRRPAGRAGSPSGGDHADERARAWHLRDVTIDIGGRRIVEPRPARARTRARSSDWPERAGPASR